MGYSEEELIKKREERGGFKEGIVLEKVYWLAIFYKLLYSSNAYYMKSYISRGSGFNVWEN